MNKITFLIDLDHTIYDVLGENLYPDAIEFLEFIKKKGDIILFTEGDIYFQKEKVKKLDLKKFFKKNIEIFPSFTKMQKFNFSKNYGKLILVDDNPRVISDAKGKGWTTVRIVRGKYNDIEVDSDYTVNNLKSIESLNLYG